jgi:hypothetical protein
MGQTFSNLAQTTIGATYTAGASTLTLATGSGVLFPSTGNFTIGVCDPPSFFLVCTARTGDVLTVNTSGAEGTTAVNAGIGTIVAQVLTAGVLSNLIAGAGVMTLLEQHSASTSASLDFTGWYSSTYDVYEIVFVNVYGTGAIPTIRFSTNGGVSYDAGNNYMWTGWLTGQGDVQSYNTNDTLINLCNEIDVAPGADAGICGTFRLTLPSGGYANIIGSIFCGRTADGGPPNPPIQSMTAGKYKSTTNPNAFRFQFITCNITAGSIRVYGIGH